ncbi:hypothetical protein AB1Y20_006190 [Prymnesium parvum]|uniref:Protein O-GlcNAc transferase n=1 Tax=Prymnesium parvum TaxID=97485 RepID=A0AB34J1Z0_PRYPA
MAHLRLLPHLLPLLLVALPFSAAQPTLEELHAALDLHPASASAHNNLAIGLKAAGRVREAIAFTSAALALDPTYARAYNSLGSAHLAAGDAAAAARALLAAVQLEPTLGAAYANLAEALRALGQSEAAATVLGQALEAGVGARSAAAYTNLGAALHASGRGGEAVEYLRTAVELSPAAAAAWINLAAALEAAGRLAEAEAACERGLELVPESVELHLNRGNVLRRGGRLREALGAYHTALELDGAGAHAALAYNNMAATLQAMGEARLAARAYEAAMQIAPHDAVARTNLDKLPVSPAYRSAAEAESRVLAHRAAVSMLAAAAALRAGRSPKRLGLPRGSLGAMLSPSLHAILRYLRRLETEQLASDAHAAAWAARAADVGDAIGAADHVTVGAFAWGGVWYHTFARVFAPPECRAALRDARAAGAHAVVLGSSLGFEAYFAALTFGVKTVGVELLCGLASLSETLRKAHGVPSQLAEFKCGDALSFQLPRKTALVYVDDTAWDAATIEQLARRLADKLHKGTIVIHNTAQGYDDPTAFRLIDAVSVGTSWDPAHTIYVHMKV